MKTFINAGQKSYQQYADECFLSVFASMIILEFFYSTQYSTNSP